MAKNITVVVSGSAPKTLTKDIATFGDLKTELGISGNYTAVVNGEPATMEDSTSLVDFSHIALTKPVKGGC